MTLRFPIVPRLQMEEVAVSERRIPAVPVAVVVKRYAARQEVVIVGMAVRTRDERRRNQ